jgi:hypothetical protein
LKNAGASHSNPESFRGKRFATFIKLPVGLENRHDGVRFLRLPVAGRPGVPVAELHFSPAAMTHR